MAVAYASSTTATLNHGGGTATFTITKPSGTASGDMLIVVMGINGNTASDFSAPGGWTTLFTANDGTNYGARAFWKIAGGSEPASYDFSIVASGGDGCAGFIVRVTGSSFVGIDNILFGSDVNTAAATNHTFTVGVTPMKVGDLLILGSFTRGATTQSTYAITNNNPTWTEREDVNTTVPVSDAGIAFATASASAASATGDATLVLAASQEAVGFLIAVAESTNLTVNPAVITATFTVQSPTVTGSANVSPAVVTLTANINAPTVTISESDWSNVPKSTTIAPTNIPKS